ncbi:hypothetical protein [Emticicia sp. 17c]|uniref:hypothetical protein n=1 Tax=Emticicia sp. 17c TaxID=3127704 RepID=UPI00301E11FA
MLNLFYTVLGVFSTIVVIRYVLKSLKSSKQSENKTGADTLITGSTGSAVSAINTSLITFTFKDAYLQSGNYNLYADVQDTYNKNASGSGFTNRDKAVYANGQPQNGVVLFLDANGTTKLADGFYYYGNKAISVNAGIMTFIEQSSRSAYQIKDAYLQSGNYNLYADVQDAYNKNASGSGFTNRNKTIYANGTLQNGVVLYLDANGTTKLADGIYYYAPAALNVTNGIMTFVVEQVNTAFTTFESTELPNYISGISDVGAKNTLGFEIFPNTNGQPSSTFYPKFIWGDGVEFLNHSGDNSPIALAKGLATGFDNGALNSSIGVPSHHRYKWTLYGDYQMWNLSHEQLQIRGAQEWQAIKSQSRDSNKNNIQHRFTMLDIEEGVSDMTKINSFLKGMYEAAKIDDPQHMIIYYGYKPNGGFTFWHNGYSYDGDDVPVKEKFFPFAKHSYNVGTAQQTSGIIQPYFSGKTDLMYNILVNYAKVNLPLTSTMYKKSGGNYIIDEYGDRVLRDDFFEEVIRGETIRWAGPGNLSEITIQEQNNYGIWRLMPELYFGIHQFAGYYSEIYYRLKMLAGLIGLGDDFQDVHSHPNAYGTIGILRHDLEANPFTNLYRPIDRVTSEWYATLVYTLLNNLSIWTGFTGGNVGLSKDGAYLGGNYIEGLHKTVNEGQPFSTNYFGDGNQKNQGHLGNYRQWAAKMYQMQAENRVYGLWQKTDKICAFCDPEQIHSGQAPFFGRLNGNVLKIQGIEARLELGESFNVKIKNTKNGIEFLKTVNSKQVLNETIILPAGQYNAQDVYIEYTNPVKGGLKKVNGIAQTI